MFLTRTKSYNAASPIFSGLWYILVDTTRKLCYILNNNIIIERSEGMSNSESVEVSTSTVSIDESNTAIPEYLDIVKSEYEIERNKKASFENRAGIILALLGAICIFLFEKVKIDEIIKLMKVSMTFIILIKIVSGFLVYGGFIFTMIMILETIIVKKHQNFEVKNINERLLAEKRIDALAKIIFTYRDIIVQHREMNEKRAKSFRRSLYGCLVTLVFTIIYISIS